MAAVMTGRPFHTVAIHANTWTALKIEMVMLAALKKLIDMVGHADSEHMVDPDAETNHARHHRGNSDIGIADDGAPREHWEDHRDHAGGRQKNDVNPRDVRRTRRAAATEARFRRGARS